MKITVAQLNPTVGDLEGNFNKLKAALDKGNADGSDLIVFPELYVVGYPPKDLMDVRWFLQKTQQTLEAVKNLSREYSSMGILVGAPLIHDEYAGKGLYNGAALFFQGEVLHTQAKSLLPTYDVFDEARYFDPASLVEPVDFKGERLGITICEDAWSSSEFWPERRLYTTDPVEILAQKKATLLINISASPFTLGKEEIRYRLMHGHALKHGIPFLYVNQVGGNDELIFDGRSMLLDGQGEPILLCPAFQEHLVTVETGQAGCPGGYVKSQPMEELYQALVLGIRDYMGKSGFSKAVIGLSGGIDSALTCVLAAEAVGAENVLGISMPSPYSSLGSVEDSRQLAANLSVPFKVVPIADIYNSYLDSFRESFAGCEPDTTEENIQARIRGNILMAYSNKFGHLLLSTGNKSEMAVGYCTLYGDMSGGLSVLADVPKVVVYQLSEYINREREIIPRAIIDKAPSAELRPDQTDQDTLPPYPVLDQILRYYIEEGLSSEEIVSKGFERNTVNWVLKAVDRNEYKRKQAAPGLKVTTKAFGVGRRMPLAARIPSKA